MRIFLYCALVVSLASLLTCISYDRGYRVGVRDETNAWLELTKDDVVTAEVTYVDVKTGEEMIHTYPFTYGREYRMDFQWEEAYEIVNVRVWRN